MATGIISVIKRAALDAVENAQLLDLRYGTVISTAPLKVKITNQFILPESLLVVPKQFQEDDPLANEDKVALLRERGGRSYLILCKI